MWFYEGKPVDEIPDGFVGFVYEIERLDTGRKYVGKKLFTFARAKRVKGRKNRVRSRVESDWKQYFGSNAELKAEVDELGPGKFRRRILHLCTSKSELSYMETKIIFERDAILRDDHYNAWVSVKVKSSPSFVEAMRARSSVGRAAELKVCCVAGSRPAGPTKKSVDNPARKSKM